MKTLTDGDLAFLALTDSEAFEMLTYGMGLNEIISALKHPLRFALSACNEFDLTEHSAHKLMAVISSMRDEMIP